MREDVKDWLFLLGKSFLLIVGGILSVAALVDISVIGWNRRAALVLLAGLALAVPPLAFAFRDALREAKKGRL
ncbi:MAG TPA: hypothetical protein VFH78_04225 [Candidatus Thermoplasmatota archaeon]|nr:hypothetical protein [Candidatus Thermoplasmatota archaeon]